MTEFCFDPSGAADMFPTLTRAERLKGTLVVLVWILLALGLRGYGLGNPPHDAGKVDQGVHVKSITPAPPR